MVYLFQTGQVSFSLLFIANVDGKFVLCFKIEFTLYFAHKCRIKISWVTTIFVHAYLQSCNAYFNLRLLNKLQLIELLKFF